MAPYAREEVSERSSAEEFVENLIKEGSQIPCDDTHSSFDREKLPHFYDAEKFKRGQKFFQSNVFPLFFGKLLGLLAVLSMPTVLKILQFTKMSGCPMTAYKRYMETLLHMNIWYESDFTPNSRLWQSIKQVKNKHNLASRRSQKEINTFINQRDMAMTQFGFMGFAVCRPELTGLHNISKEDFEGFIHIWRVIGYIMGIEDRFNICRDSLEDTRDICNLLIEKILRNEIQKTGKEYFDMTFNLVDGMWCMNPILGHKVFVTYLNEKLLQSNLNNNIDNDINNNLSSFSYNKLTFGQKFHFRFLVAVIFSLKYILVKLYLNSQHNLSMWIMRTYPFLAVKRYGYKYSIITVLNDKNKAL